MIDAAEERHVATADVTGAFLKAEMDDFVVVKLQGPAVEALIDINKEIYSTYVSKEKGKMVLYIRLLKAMYGTLKAPLLWYTLFANTLRENGFEINPCNKCVANKTINGSQFTICWYVDDIKFSHKDKNVVVEEIAKIEKKFDKMTKTFGNKHTYLGMNFEIKGKAVIMEMKEYLEDCIQDFPEKIDTAAKTPLTKTLTKINHGSLTLDHNWKEKFHSIVQKLLHLSKRARLDVQVTVWFLCTRVREPTIEDWRKLKRLLQYVFGSLDLKRIMSLDSFKQMSIYIDASHACYDNMRGQTGGA